MNGAASSFGQLDSPVGWACLYSRTGNSSNLTLGVDPENNRLFGVGFAMTCSRYLQLAIIEVCRVGEIVTMRICDEKRPIQQEQSLSIVLLQSSRLRRLLIQC